MNAWITGNSSGLGLGFTKSLLASGTEVWGCSRRGCPMEHQKLHDARIDLASLEGIPAAMDRWVGQAPAPDLVILNAGVLGRIRDLHDTPMDELRWVMDINVWANKAIIDWLINRQYQPQQLVLISSGAAVNGNRGWSAYALSKATLNMLAQLYAAEMTQSHVLALAPGLVDTAMQDVLCDPEQVEVSDFPSVQKLRDARGSNAMPGPDAAAEQILSVLPGLRSRVASGSFVDVRKLDELPG